MCEAAFIVSHHHDSAGLFVAQADFTSGVPVAMLQSVLPLRQCLAGVLQEAYVLTEALTVKFAREFPCPVGDRFTMVVQAVPLIVFVGAAGL